MTGSAAPTLSGRAVIEPTAAAAPRARSARSQRLQRRVLMNLARLGIVVVLLLIWEWGVNSKNIDPFFWGEPSQVWATLKTWVTVGTPQGSLGAQILVTLQEAVYGFVIGVVLGVICGVGLGSSRLMADLMSPFIKVANSIPRIILGSIFTVAFGFGVESKIVLAVVLVFFGVFFNAFQGTREVDRNLISNARILGASRLQVTRQVVIPSAFTWILASLHISFGLAIVGAVVGELFGATAGLGQLIYNAGHTFDVNGVFAGMFLLAVLALIAEGLISALENRLIKWRPSRVSGEIPI